MILDKEVWANILDYENLYQASNLGGIRSSSFQNKYKHIYNNIDKIIKKIKNGTRVNVISREFKISRLTLYKIRDNPLKFLNKYKNLKPFLDGHGYPMVALHKNKIKKYFNVHILIFETFNGKRPYGKIIRHIDGNCRNNELKNLELGTYSDNEQDKKRHGKFNHASGSKSGRAKLNEKQVRIIKWLLKDNYLTINEIADIFRVHIATIYAIKNNRSWKHIL